MCGIAGFIWRDPGRPADRAAVRAMCDVQAHRGPDDAGLYTDGPVGLGHRRLAILDLSAAGHQPMASADGRFVIVFNGEIYNYVELAAELKAAGSTFRSGSDTEVILEAYRRWGRDCVTRFNGMWAFALHDTAAGEVFLSRDRAGIKPLYYAATPTAFLFASEIKALAAVRPDLREPYPAYLARFLTTGVFDDGEETCFRHVRQLLPAHNATWAVRSGDFKTWRYWALDPARAPDDGDPVERLADLLDSAVRLHMRSDVPVGTCLSGGVDSSTIVSLMSRLHPDPVKTFSGLYPDPGCNERAYVDLVNRAVGCQPFPVFPEPRGDLMDDLARITWHQDEPTAGPGLYTQFHVMRRAAGEVKVILDGQGADELFAGYLHYFQPHLRDLARQGLRGRAAAVLLVLEIHRHWGRRTAAPGWNLITRGLTARVGRGLARLAGRPPAAPAWLHPAVAERAATEPVDRQTPAPFATHLDNQLFVQATSNSIPALLHYEDRNSMAFSIESRVPLLDYRIVEFAFGLGARYKIHGSWTKWVLRKVAARLLPSRVAWRRSKMGYPTPMARWFRSATDGPDVEDVLFSPRLAERELVSADAVRRLWQEHLAGADHSWVLYRILTTELWFRHFIDRWDPRPAERVESAAGPPASRVAPAAVG